MKGRIPSNIADAVVALLAPFVPGLTPHEVVNRLSSPPSEPEKQTRFLTVAEAAKRLRVSRQTIHSWRKAGRLADVKVNRRVLIPEKAIENLVPEGC